MRSAIQEQELATRAGLEFLQVAANKAALEALCKEQKEQIQEVEAHTRKITLEVSRPCRVITAPTDVTNGETSSKQLRMRPSGSSRRAGRRLRTWTTRRGRSSRRWRR